MSLGQSGKVLARFALKNFKVGFAATMFKPAASPPSTAANTATRFWPTLSIQPHSISILNVPALKIRKEISDPLTRTEITTPKTKLPLIDITLPNVRDDEVADPTPNTIVEKRAARLIVIRRAKMKKHKWRKLQKKMKFVFAKKRQKRELKKEKAFQAVLLSQVKEAERFDAQEYVAEKLRIAHWERPITRVRGFYAPDWVIRDHIRDEENKRKINERIQDCLRLKK